MLKKIILTLLITIIITTPAFAQDITVWAYREQDEGYVSEVKNTILSHVPSVTLDMFNEHGGQVVINPNNLNKAGRTFNDFNEKGQATFDTKCYMELTPDYGIDMMKYTALHEFGHVLDLETKVTYDPDLAQMIRSEVTSYNDCVVKTGFMIPEYYDEHELFAQVHAAVLGIDGTQPYAAEIQAACPKTTALIRRIYGVSGPPLKTGNLVTYNK